MLHPIYFLPTLYTDTDMSIFGMVIVLAFQICILLMGFTSSFSKGTQQYESWHEFPIDLLYKDVSSLDTKWRILASCPNSQYIVLRLGEGWPKACGVPCSIKFSLNHFLRTLYVNTAFLRCVASGYSDERASIKIYCTVLNWTVWFKSYSILKMSGIDGSFILYNNRIYCIPSIVWKLTLLYIQICGTGV